MIFRMTGECVSEGSLLTSTAYWNLGNRAYWPEMLDFLGIDAAMLPGICELGEPVGTMLPHVAEELGLSPGVLVATGRFGSGCRSDRRWQCARRAVFRKYWGGDGHLCGDAKFEV